MQKISSFLWFDNQAEEAANFYVSIFKNSKILSTARYTEAGSQAAQMPAGSVMTVNFVLDGVEFTALNGGPVFKFNESISFVVKCDSQEEIDEYWNKLSEGGDINSQQCGWLKDKFGLSWQIVPSNMDELFTTDSVKSEKVMKAMLQMKKLDINVLRKAAEE